jgi:HD-like signal output (HDOD) protein
MPQPDDHGNPAADLKQRVLTLKRLAAMPQSVWQLMGALRDERTDAASLGAIIERDAALASKVLGLANSAYYGMPDEVTTVQRAVVIIGYQELEMLALTAGLADVFDTKRVPDGFDAYGLWIHCLSVGWVARVLATRAGQPNPGEIMVSGLLHDLGKLILASFLRDELAQVLELQRRGTPYYLAEEAVGVDHCLIGHWLSEHWKLPHLHASVIRHHHSPGPDIPYSRSVGLVFLADEIVKGLGFGQVQDSRPQPLDWVLKQVGLSRETYKESVEEAQNKLPPQFDAWKLMLNNG